MTRALALFLLLGACVQAEPASTGADGDGVLPVMPTSLFAYSVSGAGIEVEVEGANFGQRSDVMVSGQAEESLAREMAMRGCAEAGGVLDTTVPGTLLAPSYYLFAAACQT